MHMDVLARAVNVEPLSGVLSCPVLPTSEPRNAETVLHLGDGGGSAPDTKLKPAWH